MSSRMEDTAAEPRTVDEARSAVERSRQRISSTLDALEDRIVEKKHEIRERVDVLRPVRDRISDRPFTAVAVAVGVGALLGSLGGDDDDEHRDRERDRSHRRSRGRRDDLDGGELREWRELRRERLRAMRRQNRDDGSRFDALRHQLAGVVTSAITRAVAERVKDFARGGNGRDRMDARQDWR